MFYENFCRLCNDKGIKPTNLALELGLSRGSPTVWKSGKLPNDTTLVRLADYFGVTKNRLLYGRDDTGVGAIPPCKAARPQRDAERDGGVTLESRATEMFDLIVSQQKTIADATAAVKDAVATVKIQAEHQAPAIEATARSIDSFSKWVRGWGNLSPKLSPAVAGNKKNARTGVKAAAAV